MNYLKLIMTLILFSSIISCEDVIELELDDTEARIIIEANLDATKETVTVIVSKSNDFYEIAEPILIRDAKVVLIKNKAEIYEVQLTEDGFYEAKFLDPKEGDEYEVEIDYNGELYSANSTVPSYTELLTIDTSKIDIPFGPDSGGDVYQIFSSWRDVESKSNYYRLRSYTDDMYDAGNFFVMADDGFDGNLITRPIRFPFQKGSKVKMELLSTDKTYYEYYLALSTIQGEGPNTSVPFNPIGNFNNGALGYFGIYHSSEINIQL